MEKVEDAVSVDDVVWVKVLSVTNEQSAEGKMRTRVQLSIKDATQDGSAQDLTSADDAKRDQAAQLGQALNSTIGISLGLDPMGDGGLIMKYNASKGSLIHGYALVDDTEGEPDPSPAVPIIRPPTGRGRGATLPAWMTRRNDGPVGEPQGPSIESLSRHKKRRKEKKKHSRKQDYGDGSSQHKKSRKHGRKRRRHSRSFSSERYESKKSRRREKRGMSRSRSYSEGSDRKADAEMKSAESPGNRHSSRSYSNDRERDEKGTDRGKKTKRGSPKHSYGEDRHSSVRESDPKFASVEEAEKFIAYLAANKNT